MIKRIYRPHLPDMNDDDRRQGLYLNVFYILYNVTIAAVLFIYDSDLAKALEEKRYGYITVFFTFALLAIITFLICAFSNPGYVPKGRGRVRASTPSSGTTSAGRDIESEQLTTESASASVDVERVELLALPADGGESGTRRAYCDECDSPKPLRARHCKHCQRCVAKFDHHCFWLGQCVGEGNHCSFWWLLAFESIAMVWATRLVYSSFTSAKTWGGWWSANWFLLIIAVTLTMFTFIPTALVCFHTYLALCNQTTYEVMRAESIDYLRDFPEEEFPFDHGPLGNLKLFCYTRKPIDWSQYMLTEPRQRNGWEMVWRNNCYNCVG